MKETWAHFCVSQNEDVMKSMLGERIDFLEKLVAKKDAAYARLKLHLETCQDAYDRDVQGEQIGPWWACTLLYQQEIDEKDAEIERLKEGFKRNRYSFIRENAELRDEIAKLKKDAKQGKGV